MPDGGATVDSGEFFHVRQVGAFRPLPRGVDADAWRASHQDVFDDEPVEVEHDQGRLVAVFDPAPSTNPDHHPRSGVGVEHVLSEYTLRACGIVRPEIEYPQLKVRDRKELSIRDSAKRARAKERRRKRNRSRIIRNGDAPHVDPSLYADGQRWAVEIVNLIAAKRYSPPVCERHDGTPHAYGCTTWLTDFAPANRATATWIFRHVAHHGGGSGLKKKYSARTIISALLARVFPANMQVDGDAPTPFIEGPVSVAVAARLAAHPDSLEMNT